MIMVGAIPRVDTVLDAGLVVNPKQPALQFEAPRVRHKYCAKAANNGDEGWQSPIEIFRFTGSANWRGALSDERSSSIAMLPQRARRAWSAPFVAALGNAMFRCTRHRECRDLGRSHSLV